MRSFGGFWAGFERVSNEFFFAFANCVFGLLGGLGKGGRVATPKIKFVIWIFGLFPSPPQLFKIGFLAFCQAPSKPPHS